MSQAGITQVMSLCTPEISLCQEKLWIYDGDTH